MTAACIQMFRLFCTNHIVRIMLDKTNTYAVQLRQNHPNGLKLSFTLRNWKPFEDDFFYLSCGCLFYGNNTQAFFAILLDD